MRRASNSVASISPDHVCASQAEGDLLGLIAPPSSNTAVKPTKPADNWATF